MMKLYSRKRFARTGACVAICLIVGMAVSFGKEVLADVHAGGERTLFFAAMWGLILTTLFVAMLYGAIRALIPRMVDGVVTKVNGLFVNKEGKQLVICLEGRKYCFPLSSDIDIKMNGRGEESIEARMEVGAFSAPLSLEIR